MSADAHRTRVPSAKFSLTKRLHNLIHLLKRGEVLKNVTQEQSRLIAINEQLMAFVWFMQLQNIIVLLLRKNTPPERITHVCNY